MVYHLFDMAVINGFILFKEHQAQFPDNEALKRPSQYSLGDFWDHVYYRWTRSTYRATVDRLSVDCRPTIGR